MKLLQEITEDYCIRTLPLMEAISQSIRELKLVKKGGKVTNKMVKDFMKHNSKLTAAAAMHAIASHQQYKTNKRHTVQLFAKSPYEKRMIRKVVDAMIGSKQFKLHRTKYAEGGKYWELVKVKSGN